MRLLLIALTALAPVAEARIVKLGVASNFSEISESTYNPYGNAFLNAVTLALRDQDAALKKANIQIEIVKFDYGDNPINVLTQAEKAAASDIVGLVGYGWSSQALLAGPIHDKANLAFITPSATADRVTTFKSAYSACINNSSMGQDLAKLATTTLHTKKVAIITAKDCAYCQDLSTAFKANIGSSMVLKEFGVLNDQTDFEDIKHQVKDFNPDTVLVPNQENLSGRIIKSIIEVGLTPTFLGGDGWGTDGELLFKVSGLKNFKAFSISHWHPSLKSPKSRAFVAAYHKSFRLAPNDSAVLTYDAISLAITAIIRDKVSSRHDFAASLSKIKNYEGVTGKFKYQNSRVPQKDLVLLTPKHGHFELARILSTKEK